MRLRQSDQTGHRCNFFVLQVANFYLFLSWSARHNYFFHYWSEIDFYRFKFRTNFQLQSCIGRVVLYWLCAVGIYRDCRRVCIQRLQRVPKQTYVFCKKRIFGLMAFSSGSGSDILYKSALLLSLIILFVTSWFAPISGDEYVHVKQAEKNLAYLSTFGKDKAALETPISRLKHYGQSFDTITTYFAQLVQIDNLYRFRHLSNSVVAWLTILFTSLVTLQISRSKVAAFIAVILFLVTLRFMGHAMNNLKDIPFAFAFIFSFYFLFRFLEKLPEISRKDLALLTLGLVMGISIRIGGLLIFAFYLLFTGLYLYSKVASSEWELKKVGRLGLNCLEF